MRKRSFLGPFKKSGPGRPKLSPAAKKRRQKFKSIAARIRRMQADAKYCIVSASGTLWKTFYEFSGLEGAKRALDSSNLPIGSAVIRLCDGVELAHRSASYT